MDRSELRRLLLGAAVVALMTGSWGAMAHELIVKPGPVAEGVLPFTIESTHVFVQSEEMETPANVSAALAIVGGTAAAVPVTGNEAAQRIEGSVPVPAGSAWLVGHRKGVVWSRTPAGMKPGGRDQHPGAVAANRYEKFAKTLVGTGAAAGEIAGPLGHALEIVPLGDPATVGVGTDLAVRVLYRGKPVSVPVLATYDGFTETPNSYAYFTEEFDDTGSAKVRISAPGFWVVRAEVKADDPDPAVDRHIVRATLGFTVR